MAATAAESSQPRRNAAIITVCAMLATLMQALDSTIANVALPYMQGTLAATSDQITWVLTSYIVAAAIMTAPVGWLSARFGRKTLFITCLVGFTVASMLCGLAQNAHADGAVPRAPGHVRRGARAAVAGHDARSLSGRAARLRDGALGHGRDGRADSRPDARRLPTDVYNWRWVFYVNLPFGMLAIAGLWLFIGRRAQRRLQFDWIGFAVLASASAHCSSCWTAAS